MKQQTILWQKMLLILGGTGFAVVLLALLLLLFPNIIDNPDDKTRDLANETINVEFYYSDGDLFAWLPDKIRPPEEDVLVASYSLSWDEDGFRVPLIQADAYPVVVFGDSFTEGPNVAKPYPDGIAEILGVPIRNYGYRAYGAQENAQVASEFLGTEPRSWVLYGHFSGNDIVQAELSTEELVQERTPVQLIPFLAGNALDNVNRRITQPDPNAQYDFPIPVVIADKFYEMAMLHYYMWWQFAPDDGYEGSHAYETIGNSLNTIEATTNESTCFAFIYMPPKAPIYYPFIAGGTNYIRQDAQRPQRNSDGKLELVSTPYGTDEAEMERFAAGLFSQRDAMRQLAESKGWIFIDLYEPMLASASAGNLLYYRYDTHWNQLGHDVAAQIIADTMREYETECPFNP